MFLVLTKGIKTLGKVNMLGATLHVFLSGSISLPVSILMCFVRIGIQSLHCICVCKREICFDSTVINSKRICVNVVAKTLMLFHSVKIYIVVS